jgi:hypothetical protein
MMVFYSKSKVSQLERDIQAAFESTEEAIRMKDKFEKVISTADDI